MMKLYKPFAVSLFLFLLFPNPLAATTRYVSLAGAHVVPFTSWADAATNIQSAIDAAVDGDTIWVTNGVYSTGGKVMAGDLTNRVALDKALTVRSVNGPQRTVLTGAGATNGVAAVRCAWLTNGAVLQGFTLEAGATRTSGDNVTLLRGGGVWCASSNASVFNCVIRSNAANNFGGGAYQGKLVNCLISTNRTTAGSGGAACDVILVNCTVVSNGNYGVYQTAPNLLKITNSIVYFNAPANFPGGVSCYNSCTTPLPTGSGNFTNQPGFFLDALHLTSASPCRGAGLSVASGTDIFGNAWATPPSIGCAEWQASPFIPVPRVELTGDPVGFTVSVSAVGGEEPFSFQWLKDGMPLQNDGHFSGTETIGLRAAGIHPTDFGSYQLVASNSSGAVTSGVAQVVFRYANAANVNPVPPYSTWATAATTIQDAIDAAVAGEIVLVANGLYGSGGKSMDGAITNRIAMDKAIIVQSVGGRSTAVIQGAWDRVSTNGPGAIRCAWLTNGAVLSGFTLFGGGTRAVTSSPNQQMNGGGVWGSSTNSIVNNCVITNNMASYAGGGVYQATILNSTLAGNCAVGSGMPGSGVAGAGAGGGAANCNLRNCFLSENVARQTDGGGALNSNLRNCALTKNSSYMNGGAARGGTLVNCTVSGNISSGYSNNYGGAVASATVTNSILWANLSRTSFPGPNYANSTLAYTCSEPLSAGPGNFTADPKLLLDGIHTAETSPCIGAGIASVVGADIDGQTWNNPPSIGCDEWHPQPLVIGQPQASLITKTPLGLRLGNVAAAGAEPFTIFWLKDGMILNEGSHFSSTGSTNLIVNNFGPSDAGQ